MHAVEELEAPVIPLLVNLLTPVVLAFCVCSLRKGAVELFRPDNQLKGAITPIEFTSLKLASSSACALLLSLCFEGCWTQMKDCVPWWAQIQHESLFSLGLLLFGAIFVLIFQVNITWLASLTSAVSVGIVGGLKVIPQWILNAAFKLHMDLGVLNLSGAALVFIATVLYAWSSSYRHHVICKPSSLADPLILTRNPDVQEQV